MFLHDSAYTLARYGYIEECDLDFLTRLRFTLESGHLIPWCSMVHEGSMGELTSTLEKVHPATVPRTYLKHTTCIYMYIYFTYMAAPRLIPHIKLNKMKKDEHGLSFLLLAHLFQGQQLLKNARRPLRCYHGSCKGTSHPNHPLHPSISDWNSPWNTLW